jgi:hypothetical protein
VRVGSPSQALPRFVHGASPLPFAWTGASNDRRFPSTGEHEPDDEGWDFTLTLLVQRRSPQISG